MAEKPRVKAPKQRAATADDSARRRRIWVIVAGVGGLVLGFAIVAAALGMVGGSGDSTDVPALRTTMETAGCTLKVAPTRGYPEKSHSVTDPDGTSPLWNTDPPTSGPHYGIAAIFGIYEDELQMARVIHNLEHGGIYILYGDEVPDETVERLRAFYDDHQTGTIMAPLDRLGDQFALGAWVFESDDDDNGYLAKCTAFDEDAVSSFFRALQFRGPERFDPANLRPGH
jgi:hypothetical protein